MLFVWNYGEFSIICGLIQQIYYWFFLTTHVRYFSMENDLHVVFKIWFLNRHNINWNIVESDIKHQYHDPNPKI